MSIVGVICLGVLLEIVLPEGQTAKYVKGAFSLLVVFVIVAPLPKLLGAEWSLENISGVSFSVDDGYISQTISSQKEGIEKDLEDYLAISGYEADVTVTLKSGSINKIERVDITVQIGVHEEKNKDAHVETVRQAAAKRLGKSGDIVFVQVKIRSAQEIGEDTQ